MGLGIHTAVVIDHCTLWVDQKGFTFCNFRDAQVPHDAELICQLMIVISQNREIQSQLFRKFLGGVSKSMLTLNEAIIDVKKG